MGQGIQLPGQPDPESWLLAGNIADTVIGWQIKLKKWHDLDCS